MGKAIGVLAADHVAVGLVEDNRIAGDTLVFPDEGLEGLQSMPAHQIADGIRRLIDQLSADQAIEVIGVGVPGITRRGVIEDSPNLPQTKGFNLQASLSAPSREGAPEVPVRVFNDADALAAGVAAKYGHLDKLIRVWFLGNGVGFGRYPSGSGVWEGGHMVVTLDPKEHFCGCGGRGHLEGIVGHRSMRLRFLDKEPEEVFEEAQYGDARCSDFVKRWHRALAAATATSIHLDGPGKFFISGPNARFVQVGLLDLYLQEMVKMSPLQGSLLEVISTSDDLGIIGAAVNALRETRRG